MDRNGLVQCSALYFVLRVQYLCLCVIMTNYVPCAIAELALACPYNVKQFYSVEFISHCSFPYDCRTSHYLSNYENTKRCEYEMNVIISILLYTIYI